MRSSGRPVSNMYNSPLLLEYMRRRSQGDRLVLLLYHMLMKRIDRERKVKVASYTQGAYDPVESSPGSSSKF